MVIFAERFYNVLLWQTGGTNEDKDKNLDKRTIDAILSAVRQRKTIETTTVKLNTSTFEKYGLKGKTANEISDILEKALQNYFENEQEIE